MRDSVGQRRLGAVVFYWLILIVAVDYVLADSDAPSVTVKVATYNVSLYGQTAGAVRKRLESGDDRQAQDLAAVIQSVRPDILFINEIDYESDAATVTCFRDNYLQVAQQVHAPVDHPYFYVAPSNTGFDSGLDLNGNGRTGDPEDAWGFGKYPGQYAFAVLSRYPIDTSKIRTFQKFLWTSLPDSTRPANPASGESYYPDDVWSKLRLSSKNHVDVPINVEGRVLHLLGCHPTPPVFDGPEDRNGCRNHDEIMFWRRYIDGSMVPVDDAGRSASFPTDANFVLVGDLNSDPMEGDSRKEAIQSLLGMGQILDPMPRRMSANASTEEAVAHDTADFGSSGELRVDYVLPSKGVRVVDSGVFWPSNGEVGSAWIHASDHRLVWVKFEIP